MKRFKKTSAKQKRDGGHAGVRSQIRGEENGGAGTVRTRKIKREMECMPGFLNLLDEGAVTNC